MLLSKRVKDDLARSSGARFFESEKAMESNAVLVRPLELLASRMISRKPFLVFCHQMPQFCWRSSWFSKSCRIFLLYWASEASHTLGCSIEISRDIYIYVCLSYVKSREITWNHVKSREITWIKHAHAQSQYWAVKSDQWHPYYSFWLCARAALAWTEEKRSLKQLKANRAS